MNTKKIMLFGVLGLFAMGLVFAVGYYVLSSDTFNVNNINGIGTYLDNPILGSVEFKDAIDGTIINLENDLNNDRILSIEGNVITGEPENMKIEYKSNLELTKKIVEFGVTPWTILNDKVQIEYTIIGDEFSAEVIDDNGTINYVLIYYSDNIDRFTYPEEAILVGNVTGDLPYGTDENTNGYDYCVGGNAGESYDTCHGAKIWYVPSDAINGDGTLQWNRASEFYFESKLIQYNSAGEITFYSGDNLEIIPKYIPNKFAVGSYEITTTIA